MIYAHPEVTAKLCSEDLDMIHSIEQNFRKSLIIRSENNYHVEQYEIFPRNSAISYFLPPVLVLCSAER